MDKAELLYSWASRKLLKAEKDYAGSISVDDREDILHDLIIIRLESPSSQSAYIRTERYLEKLFLEPVQERLELADLRMLEEVVNPEVIAELHMRNDLIAEAVEMLPLREKRIMRFLFTEEMSAKEVAEAENLSSTRTHQLIKRAYGRLQERQRMYPTFVQYISTPCEKKEENTSEEKPT